MRTSVCSGLQWVWHEGALGTARSPDYGRRTAHVSGMSGICLSSVQHVSLYVVAQEILTPDWSSDGGDRVLGIPSALCLTQARQMTVENQMVQVGS